MKKKTFDLIAGSTDQNRLVRETLADVLEHPEVTCHGTGGRLDKAQRALATTVVALMQDRLIRESHESLRALAVGIRMIYSTPLLGTTQAKRGWKSLFTWGNFFAGSAVVLVAIAAWTTETAKNYKEKAQELKLEVSELKAQIAEHKGDARTMNSEYKGMVQDLKKQLKEQRERNEELQDRLEKFAENTIKQ